MNPSPIREILQSGDGASLAELWDEALTELIGYRHMLTNARKTLRDIKMNLAIAVFDASGGENIGRNEEERKRFRYTVSPGLWKDAQVAERDVEIHEGDVARAEMVVRKVEGWMKIFHDLAILEHAALLGTQTVGQRLARPQTAGDYDDD